MRFIKLSLLIIGLSVLSILNAQESQNLKSCIEYALKNHPSHVIFDNQVSLAEKQKLEALSGCMPQINLNSTFDDNLKRQVTVIPGGIFSPNDIKIQFGNQYNTAATIQADQIIYDQSMLAGIEANKPNIELAKLRKEQNEEQLIYNTAAVYYQLVGIKEQLKLLNDNEKRLKELMSIQQLQLEKGVITPVIFNRIQVNYNNLIAQKKVLETNYTLVLNKLKNAMGYPLEQQLSIVDSVQYNKTISLPQGSGENIKLKTDYLILEKNISLMHADYKRKKAMVLPTLSAYGRYGANAFGNDLRKSLDQWYDYSMVGLKLNIPLFSGLRRYSQIAQSQITLNNAKQNLVIGTENLKLNLLSSQTSLLSSYTDLQNNKNNVELAKQVFEETSLQYAKGAASLSDFLNADYSYKEAQSNYVRSLLTYLISRVELEYAKGTLKQFVNQL